MSGKPVVHSVMNPHQWHHYRPDFFNGDDTPSSPPPIMQMETRLESFALGYDVNTNVILGAGFTDAIEYAQEILERDLRNKLSQMGLLIPDSMEFSRDENVWIERGEYRIILRANALMPTYTAPVNQLPPAQRRYPCNHCGCSAFEDQFHSGTCENCGAPFDSIQ
jgi:hypothetical protein